MRSMTLVAMAIGVFPPMESNNNLKPRTLLHIPRATNIHSPSFMLVPQTALFFAIDLHCCFQNMDCEVEVPLPKEAEVTYYVNMDYATWVEQRFRRHVNIELKLECTRNRSRDVQKTKDDWLCFYCKGSFPSKLRLRDHCVEGCPCGPVDSTGSKWKLHALLCISNSDSDVSIV